MSHVDEGTLHAYLDGELPSSERTVVDAHLAQCATCRATLAEERALLERASALLGSARPIERPAPPFEQLRRSTRSPWRVRTPFAWAASIMLALGLGYYLRDPGNDAAPATPGFAPLTYREPVASTPVPTSERQERSAQTRRESERIRRPEPRADELGRTDALSRTDSVAAVAPPAAAAGALALKSSTELRNAAPTLPRDSVLRLEEVVITRESQVAARRGRGGTTQWQIISRGAATSLLGTDPVGLPGLATRRIRRSPAPDQTVVVEQALDSSTVIQIFQRPAVAFGYTDSTPRFYERDRAAREAAPAAAAAPADRLARFVGRLRVEISGPLSADSLNRLLEQVEPLP